MDVWMRHRVVNMENTGTFNKTSTDIKIFRNVYHFKCSNNLNWHKTSYVIPAQRVRDL